MGTLGDLTGGFVTGKDAGDRWASNRQGRRMNEQAIEAGEIVLGGKRRVSDAVRRQVGAEPLPEFESTLGDPFAKKFLGWFQNLGGGTQTAPQQTPGAARGLVAEQKKQALPVGRLGQPEMMADGGSVMSQVGQGEQVKGGGRFPGNQRLSGILFMADGGSVPSYEESDYYGPMFGPDRDAETPGRQAGRGLASPEGMANFKEEMGAAGSWIKDAAGEMVDWIGGKISDVNAGFEKTGEMATRGAEEIRDKALELGDASVGEFPGRLADVLYSGARTTGATAGGVLSDVGRMTGLTGGDETPAPQESVEEIDPSTLPQKIGGQGGGAGGGAAAPSAPQQALPVNPSQPQEGPINEIGPDQMPNMGVDEWKEYRRDVVVGLVDQGMNPEEAFRTVDQTVTGLQQRGFLRHLKEAQSLMQAGDKRGAIRALYAGYQYFPNGKDVRFGMQNGEIVGIGFDEKTGERTKGGMVLDPESLDVMIQNFSQPGAFKTWTMDWREFEQELRKYYEVDKPLAEQQGKALATGAQADLARARSGGAGGRYDAADMDRNRKMFVEELDKLKMQGVIPEEYDSLAIAEAVGAARARYPHLPPGVILRQVLDRYEQTIAGQ